MLTHLLAATDGSAGANHALAFAVALAREQGATLTICTAVAAAETIASNASPSVSTRAAARPQKFAAGLVLDRAGEVAARAGLEYEKLLLDGSTAEAIAESALALRADALVIGRHNATSLERFFLGGTVVVRTRVASLPVEAPATAHVTVP